MLQNKQDLAQFVDPQAKEAIDEMIQLGDEYDRVAAGVYPLVDANKLDEAKKQIEIPRLAKLEEARTRAQNILQSRLDENLQEGERAKTLETVIVVLGTLLTIAAAIALALWIALPIRRQLPKVVQAAEQIADGDLRQILEAKQDGSEIGQLMTAFHYMNKNLHDLIQQMQRSGVQISTSATQIAAAGKELEATVAEQLASTHEVSATS